MYLIYQAIPRKSNSANTQREKERRLWIINYIVFISLSRNNNNNKNNNKNSYGWRLFNALSTYLHIYIKTYSIKTYHSIKTYSIKTYRKHIKDLSSRNTFQLQEERYLLFILFHGSMLRWSIHRQKSPQISSTKFWLWAYWLFLAVLIRQKDLYVIIKFMHSISLMRIYIYI